MDMRLKTLSFEAEGESYELCCNFNVLAELEEERGGVIALLDSGKPMTVVRTVLAAMLNDAADRQGLDKRFTPSEAGRLIPTMPTERAKTENEIMRLFLGSLRLKPEGDAEESPKN